MKNHRGFLNLLLVLAGWAFLGAMAYGWGGPPAFGATSGVFALLTLGAAMLWLRTERREALIFIDDLTGAYNYRYLRYVLPREAIRYKRDGKPLSFLWLDIRDFKVYNDRYGHLIGNEMLVRVTEVLQHEAWAGGTVVRFGGDEFAVILPGVGEETARIIGEQLAGKIAERLDLVIDVGVQSYTGGDPDELLHAADMDMYQRKRRS